MGTGTTWIWGRHPVLEASRAKTARTILLAAGRRPSTVLEEIRAIAAAQGIPLREVSREEIERLAPGENTQGVVAQVLVPKVSDLPRLLRGLPPSPSPFLLILDQIQDPHNLGALLRTANAAGVQGVIVPQRRSAPISGTVAKTSAGASAYLSIVEVPNVARALEILKGKGIWIAGLDGSATQTVYDVDLAVPLALVVGSEGQGLRRLTREHCDFVLRVPMLGQVESLNAAVAGSIVMFEVVRQRRSAGFIHLD